MSNQAQKDVIVGLYDKCKIEVLAPGIVSEARERVAGLSRSGKVFLKLFSYNTTPIGDDETLVKLTSSNGWLWQTNYGNYIVKKSFLDQLRLGDLVSLRYDTSKHYASDKAFVLKAGNELTAVSAYEPPSRVRSSAKSAYKQAQDANWRRQEDSLDNS